MLETLRRAWTWLRVRTYNEYTIGDYFRRQGASVGEGTRIMIRSLGSEPYLVTVGDEALISNDVCILTHDGATWVMRDSRPEVNKYRPVTIGRRAFIGARAILLPGSTVGERSIIGAGSVVRGAIPAGVVAAGVPAKVLCTVDEFIDKTSASSLPLSTSEPLRDQLERLLPRG